MHSQTTQQEFDLRAVAREMFDAALLAVDPARAVRRAVRIAGDSLFVADDKFNLPEVNTIYSIALGKAAAKMAAALSESLGDRLTGGVVSAPGGETILPVVWQTFAGGHPVPNEASAAAARAAFALLEKANKPDSLVIFLISGGGSAMLELPADPNINLTDLQTANRVLVGCGAKISEINTVRRRISAVKGGGLSRAAENARQVTLIVSDTNDGEAFNVASGPTITGENDVSNDQLIEIIERYDLLEKLPLSVVDCLQTSLNGLEGKDRRLQAANRSSFVLLENRTAVEAVERALRDKGFAVEVVADLIETLIDEGCRELVARLVALRERTPADKPAAIISGGEFVCPVRGSGTGGRNSESALRTAILFDELRHIEKWQNVNLAALFAGTDGIDGCSPAAGAIADETSVRRARENDLDARRFLENSDSHGFFAALNSTLEIGATGTNVRDIRILLAL